MSADWLFGTTVGAKEQRSPPGLGIHVSAGSGEHVLCLLGLMKGFSRTLTLA